MDPEGSKMTSYIDPSMAYAAITRHCKSDKRCVPEGNPGIVPGCLRIKQ